MYLASYHVNTNMDYLHIDSDIPGHLVYLTTWSPFVCEVFLVEQEDYNCDAVSNYIEERIN